MSNEITREEIEQKLNMCIELLRKKDFYLLEVNVNERTISHKLALYLQELFSSWHVDCEYNRYKKNPKRIDSLHKELSSGIQMNPLDGKAHTVYPDIIIHNRGTDDNLVVIEIKKMTSTEENDKFDLMKLRKYKKQLGYRYAVFLKLGVADNSNKKPDYHFI